MSYERRPFYFPRNSGFLYLPSFRQRPECSLNNNWLQFQCCGVNNASQWIPHVQGIPVSCCGHEYGAINTITCDEAKAQPHGCIDTFGVWIRSHAASIGIAGVFLILMQVSLVDSVDSAQ